MSRQPRPEPHTGLQGEGGSSRWSLVRRYGIIPFIVEFIVRDVDRVHLVVGHLTALSTLLNPERIYATLATMG